MVDCIPKQVSDSCGPRWRYGRNQNLVPREALCELAYERYGGLNFANGYSVNPDATIQLWVAEAETLPGTGPIGTIAQRTKQPVRCNRNLQQVREQAIEYAHWLRGCYARVLLTRTWNRRTTSRSCNHPS